MPFLLITMAGFIWAVSSFHRVRQLEVFETQTGFLSFGGLQLREIGSLEMELCSHLKRVSPPTGLGRGSFPDSVFWRIHFCRISARAGKHARLSAAWDFFHVSQHGSVARSPALLLPLATNAPSAATLAIVAPASRMQALPQSLSRFAET